MEISKVIEQKQAQVIPHVQEHRLSSDELKRLTDFFSILIQIDQRTNVTKTYEKPIK